MENLILGKSDKTSLIEHSKATERIASYICDKLLQKEYLIDDILTDEISLKSQICLAAKLHDIGKCINAYQQIFKGEENVKLQYTHEEISYAVLRGLFSIDSYNIMLNSVYHHHAKYQNQLNNHQADIIKSLQQDEIDNILNIITILTNKQFKNIKCINDECPSFFPKFDTHFYILARAIVVGSDVLASKYDVKQILESDSYIESIISDNTEIFEITKHPIYKGKRFKQQLSAVNNSGNTTIIKAPAGFGKTLTGLMWNLKSNRKLIWVCPRNIIVETLYDSIIEELNKLNISVSVEQYITGERQKCTHPDIEEFNSDIVITNIDNFLKPTNSILGRSIDICTRDVIFDEYHEFVTESALFAGFINVVKARHCLTNSKTMLLSATPSLINHLWEDNTNKTVILPDKEKHYMSAHNKRYKVSFISELDKQKKENSLTILNSISYTQKVFTDTNNYDNLIHSQYLPKDKQDRLDYIIYHFNKKASGDTNNKPSILAAPIIQASMDISFKYLTESIFSPESTVQRIGRLNRWGEYSDNESELKFFVNNIKNEKQTVRTLYDIVLQERWIEYLKTKIKENLSLGELYIIYNDFNKENENLIKTFVKNKYEESYKYMSNLYNKRIFNSEKTDKEYASSKNWRTSDYGYFCVYIDEHNNLTEPFQETYMYGREKDHKENNSTLSEVSKIIHKMPNYKKYKRTLYNNSLTMEALYKRAYDKDTPYIGLNKIYYSDIGLKKII